MLTDSEDDKGSVTAAPSFKVMTDHSSGTVYKMNPTNGERVYATRKKGPAGFRVAVFDDLVELENEIPHLLLEAEPKANVVMKRPAAAPKKKTPLRKLEEEVAEAAKNEEATPVEEEAEAPAEEDKGEEEEDTDADDDSVCPPTVQYDEQGIDRSNVPKFEAAKMKRVKSDASEQSYITAPLYNSSDSKPVLIVSVSAVMAARSNKNHKDVIDNIYNQLKGKLVFDKAQALQLRSQFLS